MEAIEMVSFENDLKLYKISGFYVREFYVVAYDKDKAAEEARRALSFTVSECKIEETEWKPGFWKQLFGK